MSARRISQSVVAIVILLCAYLLARLSWQVVMLFLPPALDWQQPPTAPRTAAASVNHTALLAKIQAAQLFGESSTTPSSTQPRTATVQETRLPIRLLGLVQGAQSVAVLEYANRQGAYRPGETISNNDANLRLRAIYPDHVIIDNHGTDERLALPQQPVRPAGVNQPAPDSSPADNLQVDLSSADVQALLGGDARQILQENPLALARFLTVAPSAGGYRISSAQDPRLLQASGLHNGDVVTHLNGVPVNTLDTSQFYQLLQSSGSLALTVQRDGQRLMMDLRL